MKRVESFKIYGATILGAFCFLNKERKTKPFFVYDIQNVHRFFNEKYKYKEDLFMKRFKPKIRKFPFFKNFEDCLSSYSLNSKNSQLRVVFPTSVYSYPIKSLETINKDSLKYSIDIAIDFDRYFGCDKKEDKNKRTIIQEIILEKLPAFSAKDLYEKLICIF